MNNNYAVELRGISKIYPGSEKKANNNINLGVHRGEILCIAGENGAGKTTLMKILDGIEKPDTGAIYINGRVVAIDSPLAARRLGLGMVHQHFMLFPEYTVAENIVMGMEPRRWGIFFYRHKASSEAAKIIKAHHFSIDPETPVHSLSVGEMQQVEICRLLYRNAKIIILDEPTSVLTGHETAALFTTLRALARAGKSLFLISHKLNEIKQISDRVAVIRQGELKGIFDTGEIDEYEISKIMLGNDAAVPFRNNHLSLNGKPGKPVIVFDNVTVLRKGQIRPLLDRVSFSVRSGEILGFTGVGGNGLGVLEAALGGFLHPASGSITHKGRDISRLNIRRLRNQGLAYIPADRQRVGSALSATVNENMIIDRRGYFAGLGFLKRKAVDNFCAELVRRYNIAGARGNPASTLSGGNLQKLIFARETNQFRDYFVFSEPSWGLDAAAGSFVWKEIAGLREKGAAIIIISTDLDEILALAGRIMVMYRGRIAAEFANDLSENDLKAKIGNCMQGLPSAQCPEPETEVKGKHQG
jgi:simple sugar transport system ATP-binding protein